MVLVVCETEQGQQDDEEVVHADSPMFDHHDIPSLDERLFQLGKTDGSSEVTSVMVGC